MTTESGVCERIKPIKSHFITLFFGDAIGLSIFLGSMIFLFIIWRIDFFITDNYTIANTLVAVSNGHLHVDQIVFGPASGEQPGMHIVGERLYGRNYGLVFLALPILWLLEATSWIVDLRIAIAAVWSLFIILLSAQIGRIVGNHRIFSILGSVSALAVFSINVTLATQLARGILPLMALQLTTMLSVALLGVVGYRLLRQFESQRIAAMFGAGLVFATPITFWGVVPKRHALTALVVMSVVYCFAASRSAHSKAGIRIRGVMYATIGLLAWLHAAEALIILVVVAPVDYLTARETQPRELAFLVGVFGLSLLPFLLTNILISGNPFQTPRMLPSFRGGSTIGTGAATSGMGPVGSDDDGLLLKVIHLVMALLPAFDRLFGFVDAGLMVLIDHPDRLVRTFIRSGWLEEAQEHYEPAINLTILESTPILGSLIALPMAFMSHFRKRDGMSMDIGTWSVKRKTDLLVCGITIFFILMYLPRLPLHAQVTVRYLVPIVPLLVFGMTRISNVKIVLQEHSATVLWMFAGTVLILGQFLTVGILSIDPTIGEVVQFHAVIGLVAAGSLALWFIIDNVVETRSSRIGAGLLGVTAGLSTYLVLLSSWHHFDYGELALGLSRVISNALISL